jgi:hypothetical protein
VKASNGIFLLAMRWREPRNGKGFGPGAKGRLVSPDLQIPGFSRCFLSTKHSRNITRDNNTEI